MSEEKRSEDEEAENRKANDGQKKDVETVKKESEEGVEGKKEIRESTTIRVFKWKTGDGRSPM